VRGPMARELARLRRRLAGEARELRRWLRWRELVRDAHAYGGLALVAWGASELWPGSGRVVLGLGLLGLFLLGVRR